MAPPSSEQVLSILEFGDFTPKGKFLWGSNFTFLVEVTHREGDVLAVYKPTRGERPLWDFPPATLAGREVAAYIVSEALGWGFVPPTVYRANGPEGPGSLQLYIDHEAEYHYFNFSDGDRQRLRPVVLFDLLINNADRKGSHLLIDSEKNLWLIDHGICFHAEYKLRTVVWDFAGELIPERLCGAVAHFLEDLAPNAAVRQRLEALESRCGRLEEELRSGQSSPASQFGGEPAFSSGTPDLILGASGAEPAAADHDAASWHSGAQAVAAPKGEQPAGASGYHEWTGHASESDWKLQQETKEAFAVDRTEEPFDFAAPHSASGSGADDLVLETTPPAAEPFVDDTYSLSPEAPSSDEATADEFSFPHFVGKPVGPMEGRVEVTFEGGRRPQRKSEQELPVDPDGSPSRPGSVIFDLRSLGAVELDD